MRTMYLGSYMEATNRKKLTVMIKPSKKNITLEDHNMTMFTACENANVDALRGFRKFDDLIVDEIVEELSLVFCHMSPTMIQAGFNKSDYYKKEQEDEHD